MTIPHLGEQVLPRGRLMSVFDEVVVDRPVTLVAAPAGFGKTSALVQWCCHTETTVGWLTVDEFDGDPRRFFRHVVAALQVAAHGDDRPDAGPLLDIAFRDPIGRWPEAASWPDHHDELLRALEALEAPLVLVVDDLHLLAGAESREIMARLIRLTPGELHLLLSSRSDPELPLHRLRLAGGLGEVRERDLAFSDHEIDRLAAMTGPSLSPEVVRSLSALTRGWPAAVRMALLTVEHEPDPVYRLAGMQGIDLSLTEYLTEEVLGSLRPALARFILRATIGDRIDAGLADTLHGGPGGAELLAEAARRGVFLAPQTDTDGEPSYRWHPVFASQCRAIMRKESPEIVRELHRAAANHWRARDAVEAVTAALAAGDADLAADVLTERWPELLVRSDSSALASLCHKIPASLSEDAEILQLRAVGELLDGRPTDGTMGRARARAGQLPPGRRHRFALIDVLVSNFLAPGRPGPDEAVRRGSAALRDVADAPVARALGHLLVGEAAAQLQGDPSTSVGHLHEGATLAVQHQLPAIAFACRASMSAPLFMSGQFDEADSLARDSIGRARRTGQHWASIVVPAYLTSGLADFWRDELVSAQRSLDQVVRLATPRQAGYRLHAVTVLALIAVANQDAASLARAHALATQNCETASPYLAGFVRMVDAIEADARGNEERAVAEVRTLDSSEQHPIANLWGAELHRRSGDAAGAWAALARIAPEQRVGHVDVAATLTEALLEHDRGNAGEAQRRLELALEAAGSFSIRRPFVERGPDLRGLLDDHHARGNRHVGLVADLIDRMQQPGDGHRKRSYWELTDREHTVLSYLRSPMTTTEIAEALFVSSNTVKTHLRAIYRKLGAGGRRDAIRIATERHAL
ncbi:LuxR C-terminal-related transcriptional regulator [Krasilnikoviella flava]|uniref:LuxR C-terminal-related transcriptional regulator n=1 Tax=Krasilnikoviella flava TaxID=526729 RepID=UPI00111BF801|nr:LuxR C-terminal-related transcriptional regulator [Krasilnikoviella flava]